MRQIWIPKSGPPEVLELREAPDPEPGPGELRVRVEAAGVNFADIMGRMGLYPDLPPLPVVVGYEVAGRIDRVGAGVDARQEGRDGDKTTTVSGRYGWSSVYFRSRSDQVPADFRRYCRS